MLQNHSISSLTSRGPTALFPSARSPGPVLPALLRPGRTSSARYLHFPPSAPPPHFLHVSPKYLENFLPKARYRVKFGSCKGGTFSSLQSPRCGEHRGCPAPPGQAPEAEPAPEPRPHGTTTLKYNRQIGNTQATRIQLRTQVRVQKMLVYMYAHKDSLLPRFFRSPWCLDGRS